MEWTWGWGAVVVAVIAAGFAGWQAWEARQSRTAAMRSQAAAEAAAVNAAESQQRTADALSSLAAIAQEQHESARAAAARKPDPWRLEAGRFVRTGKTRMLVLGGDEPVFDVELTFERAPNFLNLDPNPVPNEMHPGDGVEIYWMITGGDESTNFVVEVHWRRDGDTERRVTRGTLS